MDDLKNLRVGLFTLYLAAIAAAMVAFIASGGEANWLVKILFGISGIGFYGWAATYLWRLMPHKLVQYYMGDTPWTIKILKTVFWLDLPLFVLGYGAKMALKSPERQNYTWLTSLDLYLAQYVHYLGGILAFSVLGLFFFGMFTGRIVFGIPVIVTNRRDKD